MALYAPCSAFKGVYPLVQSSDHCCSGRPGHASCLSFLPSFFPVCYHACTKCSLCKCVGIAHWEPSIFTHLNRSQAVKHFERKVPQFTLTEKSHSKCKMSGFCFFLYWDGWSQQGLEIERLPSTRDIFRFSSGSCYFGARHVAATNGCLYPMTFKLS